ncbi:hypothetical protein [Stutzerimonas stutzeri]|uniref:hypothetical protein n=1 Tax=Stutzerimonas stutzeri TaxID=316 RepID=UPI00265D031B|nr:hypothetical protein [Stutzerimonas stutzeri]MCF6783754.1 hypothetical protein [Stutzerimonas stutzeri]
MSRRSLNAEVLVAPEVSVTYQASLEPNVVDAVRESFGRSGQTWPEWAEDALARLLRESPEELQNLLSTHRPTSRSGKVTLSFRVYPATLATIRNLATTYKCPVQAVIKHAFFMHSLAADFS